MNLNDVILTSPHSGVVDLQSYYRKPIVVFNGASLCGYTNQLLDFQKLYETGKIIPMAIPTNQFGNQEPGNQLEIFQYYYTRYGVRFIVLEKSTLETEFFQKFGNPNWNFNKYLFDKNHNFIKRFDADFKPLNLIDYV